MVEQWHLQAYKLLFRQNSFLLCCVLKPSNHMIGNLQLQCWEVVFATLYRLVPLDCQTVAFEEIQGHNAENTKEWVCSTGITLAATEM